MAALTTQTVSVAGGAPTFTSAAGGGDTALANGRTTLIVKNGDASPHDVTVVVPGNTSYGVAKPDKTYTITNGTEKWIPLLAEYADPATGRASITYTSVVSTTVAVVSL